MYLFNNMFVWLDGAWWDYHNLFSCETFSQEAFASMNIKDDTKEDQTGSVRLLQLIF